MDRLKTIPVIDIFAGPGGLSEGFNSTGAGRHGVRFSSVLSIEKDPIACETLQLRSFFHQFEDRRVPETYYRVVRGEAPLSELATYPEWKKARELVWNVELGKVPVLELHARIKERLSGNRNWVLLGGPPCQAYSLIGRARMTGIGHAARTSREGDREIAKLRDNRLSKFAKDARHKLYREYLRIVAVHQPAVFVMENVKGILSSKNHEGGALERIFAQIRRDLTSPWKALDDDPVIAELGKLAKDRRKNYRLYSFVTDADDQTVSDSEFLIKCEEYGVPQARHRVVVLGVREDLAGRPRPLHKSRAVLVRDVIGGLPALRSGLSREEDTTKLWLEALRRQFPRARRSELLNKAVQKMISKVAGRVSVRLTRGLRFAKYQLPSGNLSRALRRWLSDARLGGIIQHETRSHMSSDLGRYLFAASTAARTGRSPRLPEWPMFLLPKHRNVDRARSASRNKKGMFVDRFKVQMWDRPSSTVTSHIAKDGHYFIHPDPFQCRSLTVREAARLQTFPDNYFFCGNRTQQYNQVGNAVPPFLASQMSEVVAEFLSSAISSTKSQAA